MTEEQTASAAPMPKTAKDISLAHAIASLVILSIICGLNTVDRNMFGLILPQIKEDIALSDVTLGFLTGPAFVIVYSIAGVPLAWLADKTSRKLIISAGLAFWSVITAMMGLANNVVHLLFGRILLGVGEATNMAPTSAMIGDLFPTKNRPLALSVFAAGGPVGIMVAFPMIGWVTETYDWRSAFYMMGAIGVVFALLGILVLREPPREKTSAQKLGEVEETLSFKEAMMTAMKSKPFILTIIGGTLMSANYSAFIAWLPTFMQRVHDLNAQETGALLGLYRGFFGVISAIGGGLLVTFLNRFDARWLAWTPAIFYLGMVPAEMLLLFSNDPTLWKIGLAFDTIFLSALVPCTFALVLALTDSRMRALGASFYLLIFNLVGQSVGPLGIGILNDMLAPAHGALAIRYSMISAPVVMVIGSVMFFLLAPYLKEDKSAKAGE